MLHPQDTLDGMPSIPAVDPRFIRADARDDLREELIKVSGWMSVSLTRREDGLQLRVDDKVTITLADSDGQVIATGLGELEGGGVKRQKSGGVRWLSKLWTAKITD